jgi:hypothetical protein
MPFSGRLKSVLENFITVLEFLIKQAIGARNRVGIGLSYRPASLHGLAESIPRSLGSLKV